MLLIDKNRIGAPVVYNPGFKRVNVGPTVVLLSTIYLSAGKKARRRKVLGAFLWVCVEVSHGTDPNTKDSTV